jgi:MFS family permease
MVQLRRLYFLKWGLASVFSIATTGPEEATLSAIVFAGEIVGTAVFGPLADIFGRRKPSIV